MTLLPSFKLLMLDWNWRLPLDPGAGSKKVEMGALPPGTRNCAMTVDSVKKMFLVFLVLENPFHAAAALFSVDVPQTLYTVKLGGNVDMKCLFPVKKPFRIEDLMITWLRTVPSQTDPKEVYVLHNGKEDLSNQDTDFISRATLLKEQLCTGAVVLQITSIQLSDNGTYMCLIGYGGADYKYIDLKVQAPYATILTTSELASGGEHELVLTCSAEGFPLAEVYWQEDSANISVPFNTTYALTARGLYNVTSRLRVRRKETNNYHCLFWNKDLQETTSAKPLFAAPHKAAVSEPPPRPLSYILLAVFVPLIALACVLVSVGIYVRKCRQQSHTRKGGVI